MMMHLPPSLAVPALLLLALASSVEIAAAFAPSSPLPSCTTGVGTARRSSSIVVCSARKSSSPQNNGGDVQGVDSSSSIEDDDNDVPPPPAIDPAKRAALDGVLQRIERNYGRGSIARLGDARAGMEVDCVSSGSLTLDAALGGGYPKGRVVEIYGPESSGKTTLALHALAEAQRAGGVAAFVDAEHALDPAYAASLGVDVESLLISQPDSGEMALDIVDQLVRSSAVDAIVVDSVAALVPRAELEGDMSDMQVGLQARLMSKALRKITSSLSASRCTVFFLNQLRSKVGVIYGSPEVTSGGNALKFYASVRLDTRRREVLPDNVGIRAKVKVVKNKIAAPFRTVELDILFGTGIDTMGSLLDAALELGVVRRRGSWYAYQDSNFAQGRFNASLYLKGNRAVARKMEEDVREAMLTAKLGGDGASASSGKTVAMDEDDFNEDVVSSPLVFDEETSVLE